MTNESCSCVTIDLTIMSSDLSQVEILYLPSQWSKRLPSDQIVDIHVETATKSSQKTRAEVPSKLCIPYGTLNKEKIDIFGTDLCDDAPVFAFVHGGYWQEDCLTRDTYHFIATNLHKHGIKSIFIGYELCPNVSLPEIVEEIKIAVAKCAEYCQEHKSRGLYLAGYSAGCQLVAMLFTGFIAKLPAADTIKAAILIAGIYDLTQLPTTSINSPLKLDAPKALDLSPLRQIFETSGAKFLVIAAENDSPEFTRQSRAFHQKLIDLGMSSNLNVIKGVDHFDIVELLTNEDFEVNKLIINLIRRL